MMQWLRHSLRKRLIQVEFRGRRNSGKHLATRSQGATIRVDIREEENAA